MNTFVKDFSNSLSTVAIKTDGEIFNELYKNMYNICKKNNWGDPFSYSRAKEIYMANFLKHKVAETYSGPDGIDCDGECEYKSTIDKNIKATYNGISVQETWEKQVEYLTYNKIAKYQNHYFARFSEGEIKEIYKMNGYKVLELLLPKLKKQYYKENKGKDPRLGASLSKNEIINNSLKIM
jgi:hypothetical protein